MAEHIDQSTAPLNEKLKRFLRELGDTKSRPPYVYFHYDGFPRPSLAADAIAFLADIEAGRLTVTCGVPEVAPTEPDEDEQWAVDRGADLLEHYAAYIHRVKPENIEEHPYLPELEQVAQELRALSKRMSTPGVSGKQDQTFRDQVLMEPKSD